MSIRSEISFYLPGMRLFTFACGFIQPLSTGATQRHLNLPRVTTVSLPTITMTRNLLARLSLVTGTPHFKDSPWSLTMVCTRSTNKTLNSSLAAKLQAILPPPLQPPNRACHSGRHATTKMFEHVACHMTSVLVHTNGKDGTQPLCGKKP